MKINGYTPRQYAHDIAINWIRSVHKQHTADLDDLTDAQIAAVKAELVKLHDRLAAASRLDVTPL